MLKFRDEGVIAFRSSFYFPLCYAILFILGFAAPELGVIIADIIGGNSIRWAYNILGLGCA